MFMAIHYTTCLKRGGAECFQIRNSAFFISKSSCISVNLQINPYIWRHCHNARNSQPFIDTYIGWPGRVHDARVFVNSSLYKRGQAGTLFPDWKKTIAGKDTPLLMLGDPAYPLLPWLMKAFPDNGSLSHEQKT